MQARFKRFTALILSVLMMLTCLPMGAMAEETVIPTEDISVEVIPDDAEAAPEQETVPAMEAEIPDPEETPASKTDLESDVQQDDPEETPSISEALPEEQMSQDETAQEEQIPAEELPAEEPAAEASVETEQDAADPVQDDRHPLQAAIDTYGHIYVATVSAVLM